MKILRPSACGKTTLSKKIENKYNVSRIEIDDIVLKYKNEDNRKNLWNLFLV